VYAAGLRTACGGLVTVTGMSEPVAWRERWAAADRRLVDGLVAAVVFALVAVELARPPEPGTSATSGWAYGWAAAFSLPYLAHRRHPLPALAVTAVGVVGYAAGHWSGFPGWAVFAMVLGVAVHGSGRLPLVAYGAGVGTLAVALALQPPEVVSPGTWATTLLVVTVAWLAGEHVRANRLRQADLRERNARLVAEREEREHRAVTGERLRIARELHDVVAHSMSVIAVQASVARHLLGRDEAATREAITTVETTTRASLTEMRRLLGVLRQADEPASSLTPSPGLDDVPDLVAGFEKAGLRIALTRDGDPAGVDPARQLTVYRLLQEALTNCLRHGGSEVEVALGCGTTGVTVVVTDTGRAGYTVGDQNSTGHGLIGMRERVALFGGTFEGGPRPGGGWRVAAELPVGPA
jgi:signal transduction histidine kinase